MSFPIDMKFSEAASLWLKRLFKSAVQAVPQQHLPVSPVLPTAAVKAVESLDLMDPAVQDEISRQVALAFKKFALQAPARAQRSAEVR